MAHITWGERVSLVGSARYLRAAAAGTVAVFPLVAIAGREVEPGCGIAPGPVDFRECPTRRRSACDRWRCRIHRRRGGAAARAHARWLTDAACSRVGSDGPVQMREAPACVEDGAEIGACSVVGGGQPVGDRSGGRGRCRQAPHVSEEAAEELGGRRVASSVTPRSRCRHTSPATDPRGSVCAKVKDGFASYWPARPATCEANVGNGVPLKGRRSRPPSPSM